MSEAAAIRAARRVLSQAIIEQQFPASVLEVGSSGAVLWQDALGALTFDSGAPAANTGTLFDLASLTKPLVTTSVILDLVDRRRLTLSDAVRDAFPDWRQKDREAVTVADLLEHASGLPARLAAQTPDGRLAFERAICESPLAYTPRAQSVYSDLGFLLLGFLAAQRFEQPLDQAFASIIERASTVEAGELSTLTFGVPPGRRSNVAPTEPLAEDHRLGRLIGEVHDNYAAALGGVAGHAGLFGSAAGVGVLARGLLSAARGVVSPVALLPVPLVRRAIQRSAVPGSSRALGWDTMLVTSSCGHYMSELAFGHVGFTGTSVWIDPLRDRYFVLLTNRVCGGGSVDDMRTIRRAFHDALGSF